MRVVIREFAENDAARTPIIFLVLVAESERESKLIDRLGKGPFDSEGCGPKVEGNIRLADGYGEHYINLRTSQAAGK